MKNITVLSGKGGVGKSSITASLAVLLSEKEDIIAVDTDVDASNLGLILGVEEFGSKESISTNEKAFLKKEKCTHCEKCKDVCTFSAIGWNEEEEIPEINKFLCEGCGACKLICPEDAFDLRKVENAVIGYSDTKYGFPLISGQLKMGEAGSGKVVTEIKKRAEKKEKDYIIVDSAAGIGCPVIASVRGSDYVVGVTEPTPSGLSDLKRAFEIVDHFEIKKGIIINKFDLNEKLTKRTERFAEKNGIPVIGKLPYDKKFVESLTDLKPIVEDNEEYRDSFSQILKKIMKEAKK